MKGANLLAMMQQLGVIKSFSRPANSNDNPFSEALFKTVKYCPIFPKKPFEQIEDARAWMKKFTQWYNFTHQHSGIKFVTPFQRHSELDKEILEKRKLVYQAAKEHRPLIRILIIYTLFPSIPCRSWGSQPNDATTILTNTGFNK